MTTLERTLGHGSVVLIGLAYMTPLIVLGTYGVVAELSNGSVPTAYLVTLVAMLFTALSYGRMASLYPLPVRPTPTSDGRSGRSSGSSRLGHPAGLLLPARW